MVKKKMDWEKVKSIIKIALEEDIGGGDLTTELLIPRDKSASGVVIAKEAGILCGLEVVKEVFRQVDIHYRFGRSLRIKFISRVKDGGEIKKGQEIMKISGQARTILTGERTALNFLQRLSGIATLTSRYVNKIRNQKSPPAPGLRRAGEIRNVKVYDTRKTTPGLRYLEKYAVRCGGGENHRMGLWDGVLVKDNHLKIVHKGTRAQGHKSTRAQEHKGTRAQEHQGTRAQVYKLRKKLYPGILVEMEAENLAEVKQALAAGAEIIMLDNMPGKTLKRAVQMIRSVAGKQCKIEVSGKISLKNILKVAKLNIDRISIGTLTHSAPALDFSLEIVNIGRR